MMQSKTYHFYLIDLTVSSSQRQNTEFFIINIRHVSQSTLDDTCLFSLRKTLRPIELDWCIGTPIYIGQYDKLPMYRISKNPSIYISNTCS